ncbi:hypothetical protein D3C87_1834590 [compost metagenome]
MAEVHTSTLVVALADPVTDTVTGVVSLMSVTQSASDVTVVFCVALVTGRKMSRFSGVVSIDLVLTSKNRSMPPIVALTLTVPS